MSRPSNPARKNRDRLRRRTAPNAGQLPRGHQQTEVVDLSRSRHNSTQPRSRATFLAVTIAVGIVIRRPEPRPLATRTTLRFFYIDAHASQSKLCTSTTHATNPTKSPHLGT